MRISDWSSDVCSSDLFILEGPVSKELQLIEEAGGGGLLVQRFEIGIDAHGVLPVRLPAAPIAAFAGDDERGRSGTAPPVRKTERPQPSDGRARRALVAPGATAGQRRDAVGGGGTERS